MPDLKISQLPAASTPLAGTELVPIVQGGTTDQTTVQAILTSAVPSGTANGVLYLNGSKVATSGSALTFDGTNLGVGATAVYGGLYGTIHAYSASGATIRLDRNGAGTSTIQSVQTGVAYRDLTLDAANNIFSINGSEQMRLTSTGLGIGTSSPTVRLQLEQAANSAPVTLLRLNNSGTTGGGPGIASRISFTAGATALGYVQGSNFASGVAGLQFSGDGTNVQATLDSSGNLGLGVTPSAWASYKALQVASIGGALSSSSSSDFEITTNAYYNGGWLSQGAGVASTRYRLLSGSHSWWTSGTSPGVAGSPISFTQAMTLDASGNLVVGGTTAIGRGTFVNTSAGDGVIIRSNGFDTNKSGANNALLLGLDYTTGVGYIVAGGNTTNTSLSFFTASVAAPVERARIPAAGGMVVGTAALATNATDGFLYVPTCAGQPTGTPTTQTGTAPIVVDTTNNKLYFYSGGAWRDAGP